MDDIEKNRVEYVMRIETQLAEAQRQLAECKPLAERWTPVVHGEMTHEGDVRITLSFGGKRITATVASKSFNANTTQDITNSVANTLAESLLVEKISEVVRPEVERLAMAAKAIAGNGKW